LNFHGFVLPAHVIKKNRAATIVKAL